MSVAVVNNGSNSANNNNGSSSSVGSWLRQSVARTSFGRRAAAAAAASTSLGSASSGWAAVGAASNWLGVGAELNKVDPSAAYCTFSKHWQQTVEIMERTKTKKEVFQDDVTAVINHLRQMVTLLQVDIRQIMTKERTLTSCKDKDDLKTSSLPSVSSEHSLTTSGSNVCTTSFVSSLQTALINPATATTLFSTKPYSAVSSTVPPLDPPPTPIFDHFLGEEILDTVLEWSLGTGEFTNTLKLEQLRIHEVLLTQSRQELLVYKPVIRPLIRLLNSCLTCIPVEVEHHLVLLLNQLCASLLDNQQLLHFFFVSSPQEQGDAKFLIFSLLVPFVHREGDLGQQARDALLLCMSLSNTNPPVGQYIADTSNFCPLLAAGMCGLYSTLPRVLPSSLMGGDSWHSIQSSDILEIPNLQNFLNALEFCNAVVQVAHPVVRNELVELVYQGFLVLVLGPALHQDGAISEAQQDLSAPPVNIEEVATTTAYVELFLSYATEPQLRRAFLAFLLTAPPPQADDGVQGGREPPVVSTLISRLHSDNTRVVLVTLSLFRRILDCWCEDAMLVLVFQYLVSGTHVMLSHRATAAHPPPPHDVYRILDLMPAVLKHEEECSMCSDAFSCTEEGSGSSSAPPYLPLLQEARASIRRSAQACSGWVWRYDGTHPAPDAVTSMLEMARGRPAAPYPKLRTASDPTATATGPSTPPSAVLLGVDSSGRRRGSLPSAVAPAGAGASGGGNNTCGRSSLPRGIGRRTVGEGGLVLSSPLPHPTVLNLSHEDDQPESLGESSGYESFNVRTSRDSSPSSPPSSPRGRRGDDGVAGSRQKKVSRTSQQQLKTADPGVAAADDSELEELDVEFLKEILGWEVPEDEDGQEEALKAGGDESTSSGGGAGDDGGDEEAKRNKRLQALDEAMLEIDSSYACYGHHSSQHAVPQQDSDCDEVNWDEPCWSSPPSPHLSSAVTHARPTIGPFLEALLERVEAVLSTSVPVIRLLFSLILRLAACPSPLLTSLLLHPAIMCQPAVRSLYQVLGSLKQRIDARLSADDAHLLAEARLWLRRGKVQTQDAPVQMIAQHHHLTSGYTPHRPPNVTSTDVQQPFNTDFGKDGSKRSLTAAVTGAVGALFKRNFVSGQKPVERQQQKIGSLQHLPHNAGFRYFRQSSDLSINGVSPTGSLQPVAPHSASETMSSKSPIYSTHESSSLPTTYNQAHYGEPSSTSSISQSVGSSIHLSTGDSSHCFQHAHPVPVEGDDVKGGRCAVHSYNPEKVHAARCAVLLRQLLLQLSALAQEHAVYSPVMLFNFRTPGGEGLTSDGSFCDGDRERTDLLHSGCSDSGSTQASVITTTSNVYSYCGT